ADSVLLRCAIGGADPNWGRVLPALGTAPIPLDPNVVDVWLGGQKVAERGAIGPGDLDKAAVAMREREVDIVVDLNRGGAEAVVYTNDLTAEYVRINGEYTT
ncbi:MAG: bifunctional ornithine acetyltransferase/N-acetylglutamate synthase, partial [Actinomycetota bacterium]